MSQSPFCVSIRSDWEGLLRCITRTGTFTRVHHIELFLDPEVQDVICERFDLLSDLDTEDFAYGYRRQLAIQRFLGYDYIRCGAENVALQFNYIGTEDTASELTRRSGRNFINEHCGPITNWEEFDHYPWPTREDITFRALEWYEKHLPDDMCIIGGGGFGHFAEHLSWLMGYTTLCTALFEQRDLVRAIFEKVLEQDTYVATVMAQFDVVKALWGSDDMGFRNGPLMSPADMREFVLPGHRALAKIAHNAGKPYLLHSCGKLDLLMEDLICDVQIDAKHSFEDVIESVVVAKEKYGDRIALLGGIDVDFLCRAREEEVRERVRTTLDHCLVGGGYCLGTGNSVANYIPLNNYFAMLDEGRKYH